MRKFFLTVGYSGLFPKAPGTAGSFVSLILAMVILQYFELATVFLLAILITVVAIKQIDLYEKEVNEHDSKEIVIDELAGMWIALSVAGVTSDNWVMAGVAFVLFRLFDIYKPSIIGKIDREVKGGWGVMGDDVVAGFFAGLSTALIYQVFF